MNFLLFSMISSLRRSKNYTKDVEGREIDLASGVKLKSDMEKDRHSENSGNR